MIMSIMRSAEKPATTATITSKCAVQSQNKKIKKCKRAARWRAETMAAGKFEAFETAAGTDPRASHEQTQLSQRWTWP